MRRIAAISLLAVLCTTPVLADNPPASVAVSSDMIERALESTLEGYRYAKAFHNAAKGYMGEKMDNLYAKVEQKANEVGQNVRDGYNELKSDARDLYNSARDGVTNAYNGAVEGINRAADATGQALTNAYNNARDGLATGVAATIIVGQNLVAAGQEKMIAAEQYWNDLRDSFNAAARQYANQVAEDIKSGALVVAGGVYKVGEFWQENAAKVGSGLENLRGKVDQLFEQEWNKFKDKLTEELKKNQKQQGQVSPAKKELNANKQASESGYDTCKTLKGKVLMDFVDQNITLSNHEWVLCRETLQDFEQQCNTANRKWTITAENDSKTRATFGYTVSCKTQNVPVYTRVIGQACSAADLAEMRKGGGNGILTGHYTSTGTSRWNDCWDGKTSGIAKNCNCAADTCSEGYELKSGWCQKVAVQTVTDIPQKQQENRDCSHNLLDDVERQLGWDCSGVTGKRREAFCGQVLDLSKGTGTKGYGNNPYAVYYNDMQGRPQGMVGLDGFCVMPTVEVRTISEVSPEPKPSMLDNALNQTGSREAVVNAMNNALTPAQPQTQPVTTAPAVAMGESMKDISSEIENGLMKSGGMMFDGRY